MTEDTQDFYCDFVFSKKIKVNVIKETNNLLAFHHTKPSWTTHIVIVPKQHVTKLTELENMDLVSEVFEVAKQIILELGLNGKNFKIVTNGGEFQDSKHLHFHLLSGEKLN